MLLLPFPRRWGAILVTWESCWATVNLGNQFPLFLAPSFKGPWASAFRWVGDVLLRPISLEDTTLQLSHRLVWLVPPLLFIFCHGQFPVQLHPWNSTVAEFPRKTALPMTMYLADPSVSRHSMIWGVVGLISLVVQWIRICLLVQRTQVQSLVGKLRSYMPWGN